MPRHVIHEQRVTHVPQPDRCAFCDAPISVKFVHWRELATTDTWSLVICANYCSDACNAFADNDPWTVASKLRQRLATDT